jgi:hypothetical protein
MNACMGSVFGQPMIKCGCCAREEPGLKLYTCDVCGKTESCGRCSVAVEDDILTYCAQCKDKIKSDQCPQCGHPLSEHGIGPDYTPCSHNVVLFVSDGPCACDLTVRLSEKVKTTREQRNTYTSTASC